MKLPFVPTPLNSTTLRYPSTRDSITVIDDPTLTVDDQYVDAAVTFGAKGSMATHNRGVGSHDGNPFLTDAGRIGAILARYALLETSQIINVIHKASPSGNPLRVRVLSLSNSELSKPLVEFITDNGGLGTTFFTDNKGYIWPVADVSATLEPGWPVGFDNADNPGTLTFNGTAVYGNDNQFYVVTADGFVGIVNCTNSSSQAVNIDPTEVTTANRLNGTMTGGVDKTVAAASYGQLGGLLNMPNLFTLWIVPSAPEADRLQHEVSFIDETFPLDGLFPVSNYIVDAKFNPNAHLDGFRLQWKDGMGFGTFCYNSGGTPTNTKFYTSVDLQPNQAIKRGV